VTKNKEKKKDTRRPGHTRTEKLLQQIINEIAKSENMPVKDVYYILQYTYAWIAQKIREGDGKGVRIPYWGAIAVKKFNEERLKQQMEKFRRQDLDKLNEENRAQS